VSIMIMITMKGTLMEVVVEVEDTVEDLEAKVMVVEEVSFLMEHVIHVDPLITT
ncbi:hypothetical protein KI387_035357, partial [Taxus chinensis]